MLEANRKEIEKRSGNVFLPADVPVSEQPESALRSPSGNVIFANYGMKGGGHGHHPKIAPDYWQSVLQPWIAGTLPGTTRGGALGPLLYLVVGAALGYGGVLLYERIS